jgi:hypothetical protein
VARKWVSRLMTFYHEQLAPGPDQWPEAGSDDFREYEKIWDEALSDESIDDKQAFAAVRKLCREAPPQWRREHLPAVIEMVRRTKAENPAQGEDGRPGPGGETRESAAEQSRSCVHCGCIGMTGVFHRDHKGGRVISVYDRAGDIVSVPSIVAAWCKCPLGRWIKANHQKRDPDTARRTVDFQDVLDGNSTWLADDPSTPTVSRNVNSRIQDWRSLAELLLVKNPKRFA